MKKVEPKKFVIPVILVIALISGFLNVYLYNRMRSYYSMLYAAELDPLGLSYFNDDVSQLYNGKLLVVFFGDSRAARWVAPALDDFSFINRGIGNQTSSQVLLRFEEHIEPLQPDVVILQVCINDLKTIPLFPERKQEIIDNCKVNISVVAQNSLDLGAKVILTTVFPTSGNVPLERRLVWSSDVHGAVNEVNQFILAYQNESVIIFDTAKLLSNSEGNTKPEYVYDLLHLNNHGYENLNLELVKILENLK